MTSPNTPTNNESKRNIGALGATGVVVAAMIGTGIFTLSGVVGPDLVTTDRFVVAGLWRPSLLDSAEACTANWRPPIPIPGTLSVLANHVWPPSYVHSMCHRFGSGQCGLGCRGGGRSAAYLHPLLPSAVQGILGESGLAVALIWIATAIHPLGSFRQRVITVGAMAKVAILLVFCVLVFLSDVPSKPVCRAFGPAPELVLADLCRCCPAGALCLCRLGKCHNRGRRRAEPPTQCAIGTLRRSRRRHRGVFAGQFRFFAGRASPSAMIDADGNPVEAIGLFTAEHLLPSGVAEISGLVFGC